MEKCKSESPKAKTREWELCYACRDESREWEWRL